MTNILISCFRNQSMLHKSIAKNIHGQECDIFEKKIEIGEISISVLLSSLMLKYLKRNLNVHPNTLIFS